MTRQQSERYYKKKHDRAIIKEKELTSMKHLVVLQVGLFAESTVTDITPEWPGTVMHVHVALQITRGRERLGTEVALVGFLLKCKTYVKYVNIRCTRAEQSRAEQSRAEQWFIIVFIISILYLFVCHSVIIKVRAGSESLSTYRADMRLLS